MENIIQIVRVFESTVNYHNGEDIGPGFAVIVDPIPTTSHQKLKVAKKIQDALDGLVLGDE